MPGLCVAPAEKEVGAQRTRQCQAHGQQRLPRHFLRPRPSLLIRLGSAWRCLRANCRLVLGIRRGDNLRWRRRRGSTVLAVVRNTCRLRKIRPLAGCVGAAGSCFVSIVGECSCWTRVSRYGGGRRSWRRPGPASSIRIDGCGLGGWGRERAASARRNGNHAHAHVATARGRTRCGTGAPHRRPILIGGIRTAGGRIGEHAVERLIAGGRRRERRAGGTRRLAIARHPRDVRNRRRRQSRRREFGFYARPGWRGGRRSTCY